MFNTLFFTIFSQNKVKIGLKSNNAENMQFRSIRECYFCRKNIDMLTSSAHIYIAGWGGKPQRVPRCV